MATPTINLEHEAKKERAKKLIAAGGCFALSFWSRTDAERLCPQEYFKFDPIETPVYSSDWVDSGKKAIEFIQQGIELLDPKQSPSIPDAGGLVDALKGILPLTEGTTSLRNQNLNAINSIATNALAQYNAVEPKPDDVDQSIATIQEAMDRREKGEISFDNFREIVNKEVSRFLKSPSQRLLSLPGETPIDREPEGVDGMGVDPL